MNVDIEIFIFNDLTWLDNQKYIAIKMLIFYPHWTEDKNRIPYYLQYQR